MSNLFLGNQFGQVSTNFSAHRQQPLLPLLSNRSRRAPRVPSQTVLAGPRQGKSMREFAQEAMVSAYRVRFEAGRSFDLDDDFEFCPALLTDDDVSQSDLPWSLIIGQKLTGSSQYQSVSSASSDRSSLTSGSPELSPTLLHSQPNHSIPSFTTFNPSAAFFQSSNAHVQDLSNTRLNNNNATSAYPPKAPSPSASISPSRMHQVYGRRW